MPRATLFFLVLLVGLSGFAWAWSSSRSVELATSSSAPIAFVRDEKQLVTIRPDGSNRRLVTRIRRGRISGFSWSPNSRQIAFTVDGAEQETLHVVNANGTGRHMLARWRDSYGATGVWSPRGRAIVFDKHDDGVHQIWVINADGSGARRLTPAGSWRFPSWSPDGSRIVMGASGGVWVMKASGRDRRRVIRAYLEGSAPVWSPSNKIAFYLGDDLWIANPDGSGRRVAIKDGPDSYEPGGIEFSLDGRSVAFSAYFSPGNSELMIGEVSTGRVRRLTDNNMGDGVPTWSPDGRSLAFARFPRGGSGASEIYVINADGSGERNLTNSAASEYGPLWAPKG